MASYPTPNVHRVNRRKLGRGQFPPINLVPVTITSSSDTATITFAQAMVVPGKVGLLVTGGPTFVSQAIVSPTVVTQLFSAALATHAYTLPQNAGPKNSQGGGNAASSGTF
jgi:hypothetical protein